MLGPVLVGADPHQIERLWRGCYRVINYYGVGGAEMRALSALDIALWDLLGKSAGLPVHSVLGGASRTSVPIYNTCGDYGPMQDRIRFQTDPVGLAKELLEAGIGCMKVWPFDEFASRSAGHHIGDHEIAQASAGIQQIRDELGTVIDIAVEGHGLWSLPAAVKISRSLEPYSPAWIEDLIWPDNEQALKQLAASTNIPVMASERLMTRQAYRRILETGAANIVMLDISWTGGFTEARKIAADADSYQLPVAPHNCGGPVSHAANIHYAAHVPNLYLLETIRAFYTHAFADLVTAVPVPMDGRVPVTDGPGLGVELGRGLLAAPDTLRETSANRDSIISALAYADPWSTMKF
jgi:L-alanine-DL-glutamate epimerase-like enolase superfamily enzyme